MTKEFLNENLKPYNALTREEKGILLLASLDEQLQFWCAEFARVEWLPVDLVDDENKIYRTKPKEYKKLDIPWEFIDDYWKYAVMDNGGCLYLYATKPDWVASVGIWSCNQQHRSIDPLKLDTKGLIAEHSLTKRPEGV